MSLSLEQEFKTAGIIFTVATGEVHNPQLSGHPSVRLSPVNKRVLLALLKNARQVATRQQLFDQVWPNQVVSDDALTRSISDLRSQLKLITDSTNLIETIPKTGYRWLPPIENDFPNAELLNIKHSKRLISSPMVFGFLMSLLLLWGLIGLLVLWFKPTVIPLVILPTEYHQINEIESVDVTELLMTSTQRHEDLSYLSPFAYQAHKGNPFPYFSHEFGVRWFIQSKVTTDQAQFTLSLNLIDAKTALVIYSKNGPANNSKEIQSLCDSFLALIASL